MRNKGKIEVNNKNPGYQTDQNKFYSRVFFKKLYIELIGYDFCVFHLIPDLVPLKFRLR